MHIQRGVRGVVKRESNTRLCASPLLALSPFVCAHDGGAGDGDTETKATCDGSSVALTALPAASTSLSLSCARAWMCVYFDAARRRLLPPPPLDQLPAAAAPRAHRRAAARQPRRSEVCLQLRT
eukprot:1510485-Pleurochrysis_carterae.AAC.2